MGTPENKETPVPFQLIFYVENCYIGWKFLGSKYLGWKFVGWKFLGWKFRRWQILGWKLIQFALHLEIALTIFFILCSLLKSSTNIFPKQMNLLKTSFFAALCCCHFSFFLLAIWSKLIERKPPVQSTFAVTCPLLRYLQHKHFPWKQVFFFRKSLFCCIWHRKLD